MKEGIVTFKCTALMARVHQHIPQAGEIAYINSTSSLDRSIDHI